MTRVIVHAGFHKTGTSSLQDYLRQTHDVLHPRASIYLKEDFLAAGNAGRLYGLKPHWGRLTRFRLALRRFLRTIPADELIFLSWEGFAGVMPGHRRAFGRTVTTMTYAGIPLARAILKELRKRFGPDVQITFLYTTRETESWLRSVYGHILRSIRITEDYESFRSQFPDMPSLKEQAAQIAEAIAPVPVVISTLEDTAGLRQGPAAAALALFGLTEAELLALPEAQKTNTGNTPAEQAEFLHLNRQIEDKAALKAAKAAVLERKPS